VIRFDHLSVVSLGVVVAMRSAWPPRLVVFGAAHRGAENFIGAAGDVSQPQPWRRARRASKVVKSVGWPPDRGAMVIMVWRFEARGAYRRTLSLSMLPASGDERRGFQGPDSARSRGSRAGLKSSRGEAAVLRGSAYALSQRAARCPCGAAPGQLHTRGHGLALGMRRRSRGRLLGFLLCHACSTWELTVGI